MAVAFVRDHVTEFVKAAGTTDVYALTAATSIGNVLVAVSVFDNAGTASKPVISSISKAAGETNNWVFLGAARSTSTSAGAFASAEMWAIKTSVVWANATSLTFTYDTSTVMKSQNILEFSGAEATLRSTVGTNYSTTTTAASAVTTGTTPVVGDLAIGLLFGSNVAAQQAGDTDTTGGTWSTRVTVGSTGSSGATNNFGIVQYKILTAASHQTYNNSAAMTAGNGAIVAVLQAIPVPAVSLTAYRFYADGTESGATALAAENLGYTADLTAADVNLSLRLQLQSTNAVAVPATDDWQLQYQINAGAWSDVVAAAPFVCSYSSANLTDGAATTSRLTGGTGSFVAGQVSEDGVVDNLGWAAGNRTEVLYSLTLKKADLSNSDILGFQMLRNGSIADLQFPYSPAVFIIKSKPSVATLVEPFDTLIGWSLFGGAAYVDSGRLILAPAVNSTTYQGVTNVESYNFTDARIFAEIVDAGDQGLASWEAAPLILNNQAATSHVQFHIATHYLYVHATNGGVIAYATFNPVTHRYVALRHSSSTNRIYFETSLDGITWNVFATEGATPSDMAVPSGFLPTFVIVQASAGHYQAETGKYTALVVDNINIATPAPKAVTALPGDFTDPEWVKTGSASGTTTRLTFDGEAGVGRAVASYYRLDEERLFFKVAQRPTTGSVQVMLRTYGGHYLRVVVPATAAAMTYTFFRYGALTAPTIPAWDDAKPFLGFRESAGTVYLERSPTGEAGTWEVLWSGFADIVAPGVNNFEIYLEIPSGNTGDAWIEKLNQTDTPPIPVPLANVVGLTDSISIERMLGRDFTDCASMLRDGGGNNLLGIESSFETDTNVDGLADGWVNQAWSTQLFAVDSASLVTVVSGGHGSSSQQVTVAATSTKSRVITGPLMVTSARYVTVSVRVRNPGAGEVWATLGFPIFQSDGTTFITAGGEYTSQILPGATITMTKLHNTGNTNIKNHRLVLGIDKDYSGSLVFDNVVVIDGDRAVPGYDYVDPANRITFVSGGTAHTRNVSDNAGLTDRFLAVLGTSMFYPDIPAGVNAIVDASVNLGTTFQVSSNSQVTDLHFWLPSNATGETRRAGLYEVTGTGTGTLLFSKLDIIPVAGAWNTVHLPESVLITTGIRYKVVVWHDSDSVYPATGDYFLSEYSDPPLLFLKNADLSEGQGTYDYGSVLAYPTSTFNETNYWLDVTVIAAAAGTAHTRNVTDPIGLSDTVTSIVSRLLSVDLSDTVGLTDAVTEAITLDRSDLAKPTDVASRETVLAKADILGLTDTALIGLALVRTYADLAALNDLIIKEMTHSRTDLFGPSDISGRDTALNRADIIALTDVVTVSDEYSVFDSFALTDSVDIVLARVLIIDRADALGLTDAIVAGNDYVRDVSDGVGLSDTVGISVARVVNIDVQKLVGLTDTVSVAVAISYAASDLVGLADVTAETLGADRSDAIGLVDTIVDTIGIVRSDTSALTDTVVAARMLAVDLSDSIGLRDSIAVGTFVINVTDVLNLTDQHAIAASGAITLDLSDTIGLIDTAIPTVPYVRDYADIVALSDTRVLGTNLARVEVVGVVDTDVLATELNRVDVEGLADANAFVFGLDRWEAAGLGDIRALAVTFDRFDDIGLRDTLLTFGLVLVNLSDGVGLIDQRDLVAALARADHAGLTDTVNTQFVLVGAGWPKIWNGTAWVSKPAKVWNGLTWVEKPAKVWTGSAWQAVK